MCILSYLQQTCVDFDSHLLVSVLSEHSDILQILSTSVFVMQLMDNKITMCSLEMK